MIKSITVTNHLGYSVVLSLTDPWDTGLIIKSITGLGPPNGIINSTDLAMGDGAVYNSARIDKRNIVFSFQFVETWHHVYEKQVIPPLDPSPVGGMEFPLDFGNGFSMGEIPQPTIVVIDKGEQIKDDIEQIRLNTYKYFPLKKQVHITFETDKRTCSIDGYVEKNEPDIFSKEEGSQVSIICPDPFFYSELPPKPIEEATPEFEFPVTFDQPKSFGEMVRGEEDAFYYDGDAESGTVVTITATGSASNLTVYNTINGDSISVNTSLFEGIQNGDRIILSSVRGDKYATLIRNGYQRNILSSIPKDTSWLNVSPGANVIRYTADTGENNLSIEVNAKTLYEGV